MHVRLHVIHWPTQRNITTALQLSLEPRSSASDTSCLATAAASGAPTAVGGGDDDDDDADGDDVDGDDDDDDDDDDDEAPAAEAALRPESGDVAPAVTHLTTSSGVRTCWERKEQE